VKVGVIGFPVAERDVVELARRVEDLGFESLFHPEHTHIPVSRDSPFPATADGSLPEVYLRNLDPFVALAAAAAATTELVLGTAVCLVAQRDPIVTAKAVASLDRISGGRFVFGVGSGWNVEEMVNHGVPPQRRWGVVREHVLAMKALWTQDEASFHGRRVDLEPGWSWPKPLQRPHPPVLIGGDGPRAFDRVLDYGDGWIPAVDHELEPLLEKLGALRARCDAEGVGFPPVTVAYGPLRTARSGELGALADAGVERCLLALPDLPAAESAAHLQDLARFARA
jgi:probable F420-dependent oxidoreductase